MSTPSSKDLNSFTLSKHQRLNRWAIVGLCSAPLFGAFFYRYGYRLSFLKCPLKSLIGIPCPTCGMTRSLVAIAQGNFHAAIEYHLFGPAIFLIFLAIVISLLWELKTNKNHTFVYRRHFAKHSIYLSIGTLYLGYYAVRIADLVHSGNLSNTFWTSPVGIWIIHTHFYVS
jgi:Protein of unknown function (DUF2752)